jgi:SAM-dependent methyltransferase
MPRPDTCPSCGSPDADRRMEVRDDSVSGEVFGILSCEHCGLLYTADAPGPERIGAYYASDGYVSHTDTRDGFVNRLYHAVRSVTIRDKRRMAFRANGRRAGDILDYGCGTGAFAAAMRDAGWNVTALEPDATARENAHRLHGIRPGEPGDLEGLGDASIDVVTLWHVLEHVHDLRGTILQFQRVMRPGGTMFLAVPNHLSLDARRYGAHWAAWDVPRHLYHFCPDSMRRLLEPLGFTVRETRTMWFDAFYVSMLSEKYAHGRVRMLHAFWNGALSNANALLRSGTGSSLVYVVGRRDG